MHCQAFLRYETLYATFLAAVIITTRNKVIFYFAEYKIIDRKNHHHIPKLRSINPRE
jgi:hypothetical protein